MEFEEHSSPSWLTRPLSQYLSKFTVETLLVIIILVLAVFSRFYNLDLRVMSHDEVNHVVPSWELYQGRGYRHDPVTHGPLQFHLLALSFFLLGDSDFSARVPAALFSVAAVAVVLFAFRRYLGRSGALIAGVLFLISPFMLFYGRYTRNEGFIELFGVLMLYATLRYLDRGDTLSLFLLTAATALHFTAKETAFIYTAQLLLFLGILFVTDVLRLRWRVPERRSWFLVLIFIALFFLLLAIGLAAWNAHATGTATPAGAQPPEGGMPLPATQSPLRYAEVISLVLAFVTGMSGLVLLVSALGWKAIRSLRSFDLLILVGTLVLPQLSAFPVKLVGWDPLNYSMAGMLRTGAFVALLFAVAIGVGLWWKPRLWTANAIVFYTIFTVLYTTFFTNGQGFFTGLVGSLGYWLSQQGVQRGSQPWYYFILVQLPIYEYLAVLGSVLALYFGLRHNRFSSLPGVSPADEQPMTSGVQDSLDEGYSRKLPTLALLLFFSLTSVIAYSIAGEKMPWLTVHIALPLLLTAGWGLGFLIDKTPWHKVMNQNGVVSMLLMPVFLTSLATVIGVLLSDKPPFQGTELSQLQVTSRFLLATVMAVLSGGVILYLLKDWSSIQLLRLVTVFFFGLVGLLTARTAYMASFINYDYATEFLVYAHAAPGPKQVLAQVEEISRRITGGKDIQVAYDNDALYPYWWYLRDYPNHRWYTDKPTRDLRDFPLIIAGEATMTKMDPIVKDNFVVYNYVRLWWPMQDYFNLTWERVWNAITDARMRRALYDIWMYRDYTLYAEITNNPNLKLETWQPSSRMRFYIRKDIVAQIWNYGAAPAVATAPSQEDPYLSALLSLTPDRMLGGKGNVPGLLDSPRGIAFAPDGTIYVADSRNHRVQHLDTEGNVLHVWGSFADAGSGAAPGGTFNEPWGVAVGRDGSVYVADTWNHRVQKFTSDGQFVRMWGYFGQGEAPEAFWGPRGLAVDSRNRIYVTDTGNKRVVVFDSDGNFVTQWGTPGVEVGQFDEPVGIAIGLDDKVYVADTWNQRVQVFQPDEQGMVFTPVVSWDVYGWFGQSLENKPYITVDLANNSYITDPEGYRVIQFDAQGNFVRGFTNWAGQLDASSLPVGIAFDPQGHLWISDAGNHFLMRFILP